MEIPPFTLDSTTKECPDINATMILIRSWFLKKEEVRGIKGVS
jgi:hypothetical protein